MSGYGYLALAIAAEVVGTLSLKASEEFSRPWPTALSVVGYLVSFYFLGLVLRTVPVGVAYAVWSGVGMVLIAFLGIPLFKQVPDLPALVGIGLILAGVLVMNLFSRTIGH
ncbi:multidrug efflux SMR transporter [Pseudohaliea sp.]|uniref:DMT family transporter n=1 Tax=Pseudohaliea sp. TaxID=2740289 RepID=UPI0032EF10C9